MTFNDPAHNCVDPVFLGDNACIVIPSEFAEFSRFHLALAVIVRDDAKERLDIGNP